MPDQQTRPAHASKHTDIWTWVAQLEDGTAIWEMDEEGYDVYGLAAVPLERVVAFLLIPLREGLPSPRVVLDRAAGQRLIFTRRRRVEINAVSGEEVSRLTVHLLGYQQTVAGHNVKHLAYWFEDGSCLLSSDDQAV